MSIQPGFTAAPTYPSHLYDAGGEVFNLGYKGYGLHGDGVTLDDAAFANAFAAASGLRRSTVVVPDYATCLLSKTLVLPQGCVIKTKGGAIARPNIAMTTFTGLTNNVLTGVTSFTGFSVGSQVGYVVGASAPWSYDNAVYTISAMNVGGGTITLNANGNTAAPSGGTLFTCGPMINLKNSYCGVEGLWILDNGANQAQAQALPSWYTFVGIDSDFNYDYNWLCDVYIEDAACEGIIWEGQYGVVTRVRVNGAYGDGIHFGSAIDCVIDNNKFLNTNSGNSQHGPQAGIVYSVGNQRLKITRNVVNGTGIGAGSGAHGIAMSIDSGEDYADVIDNTTLGIYAGAFDIYVQPSSTPTPQTVQGYNIVDNTCQGGGGILVQQQTAAGEPGGAARHIVARNQCNAPIVLQNIVDCEVCENIVEMPTDTTHYLLQVTGAFNSQIHHNILRGGGYSIYAALGAGFISSVVEANQCRGSVFCGIYISGAGDYSGLDFRDNDIESIAAQGDAPVAGWQAFYVAQGADNVSIKGGKLRTDQTTSSYGIHAPSQTPSAATTGLTIKDVRSIGPKYAVYVGSATSNQPPTGTVIDRVSTDNQIVDFGTGTIINNVVGSAAIIEANGSNTRVVRCSVYQMYANASASGVLFEDCVWTSVLNDSGTNTIIRRVTPSGGFSGTSLGGRLVEPNLKPFLAQSVPAAGLTITHGLGYTPTQVLLVGKDANTYYYTAITNTTVTVNTTAATSGTCDVYIG